MKRSAANAIAMTGIGIITIAIVVGPIFSPPEFSWIRHSTSEQAGQHMPAAWLMRAGFVAYGVAVVIAALLDRKTRPFVRGALMIFGAGLIGTAVWSNASILPEPPSDMHEDFLHSVASGVVGASFAAACATRLFAPGGTCRDVIAWAGLLLSVLTPLAMSASEDFSGLFQRIIFAVSFIYVVREFQGYEEAAISS